jgi:hypothetical protein
MTEEEVLSTEEKLKFELWSDFLVFCEVFFPIVTGREFIIEKPDGRESHHIIIARELTKVANLETLSLLLNVQPGSGKSVMLCMWVAWCISRWPDCNFLYIAYGHDLAAKNTSFIKRIIESREYREIFGIKLRHDSKAKDYFMTEQGGVTRAFGSTGPVVGADAGFPIVEGDEIRMSGAVILDDMTKADEANSDTIRANILRNYQETILQRPRGPHVPIVCIAQRLHEDDICAFMLSGEDERRWKHVCLKSLDDAGNALCPSVTTKEQLLEKKDKSPYVFASQYQQNPVAAGTGLFRKEWFVIMDEEPDILASFIVCDTSETDKTWNDATAFGFFGLYELPTKQLALHWLDAVEIFVEPKDLESEFKSFYADCMRHQVKPTSAWIEKKSTGVTLLSVLQDMRGIEIRDIQRTKASGSKTQRFLNAQPIIASKMVSFTFGAKHAPMCIEHMSKITATDSHKRDDLADVCVDACRIGLTEKLIQIRSKQDEQDKSLDNLAQAMQNRAAALRGMTRW